VLENLDHAELRHALMYRAFDLYNGGPSRDWSADVHALFESMARPARTVASAEPRQQGRPSLPLERYAGTYVDSTYGKVTVTYANGTLHAQVVSDPSQDLEPVDFETFRSHAVPGQATSALTFLPHGTGGISAVRVAGITFARERERR